jgi:isoleucyl-tRNA synthetase
MLHTWQALPAPASEGELLDKWDKIRSYRAEVMRALEELRIAGSIGSPLQAEVSIHTATARSTRFSLRSATTCALS